MESSSVNDLVRQISAGFDVLQVEYRKLHGHHKALERKLEVAREQYNELAKLYGEVRTVTPPLSLASSYAQPKDNEAAHDTAQEIMKSSHDAGSIEAAKLVEAANIAVANLHRKLQSEPTVLSQGVKIWAGAAADRLDGSTCLMPSISESSLEQDFTVEGKPSRLGCPFASMANKKLSSHAASVLSRYNNSNSGAAHGSIGPASTSLSAASRINGRESFSLRQSRRASIVDPIKAEICGMSDHESPTRNVPAQGRRNSPDRPATEKPDGTEAGVCPIRFLDQHSPEEVATYFEKHKHELPRSHEVCVMRYQSNSEQIRELDAKYGNLVSMIQGLGKKHKDMLPEEPDEAAEENAEEVLDEAKVRKWASSVSAQAPEIEPEEVEEERLPHFERPLREIRVGESPSRPWGIPVPAKYLEQAQSEVSSKPAHVPQAVASEGPPAAQEAATKPAGKCPFGHGGNVNMTNEQPVIVEPAPAEPTRLRVTIDPQTAKAEIAQEKSSKNEERTPMVCTGPIFIGYSAEDAAKILSALSKG